MGRERRGVSERLPASTAAPSASDSPVRPRRCRRPTPRFDRGAVSDRLPGSTAALSASDSPVRPRRCQRATPRFDRGAVSERLPASTAALSASDSPVRPRRCQRPEPDPEKVSIKVSSELPATAAIGREFFPIRTSPFSRSLAFTPALPPSTPAALSARLDSSCAGCTHPSPPHHVAIATAAIEVRWACAARARARTSTCTSLVSAARSAITNAPFSPRSISSTRP